jgi:hypothetical protein
MNYFIANFIVLYRFFNRWWVNYIYSIAVHFSPFALLLTKQFTVPITCILHFVFIQVDPTGCSFLLADAWIGENDLKWHTLQIFIDISAQTAVFYSNVGCEDVFVMCGTELVIFAFEKEMRWKYQEYVMVGHGPR